MKSRLSITIVLTGTINSKNMKYSIIGRIKTGNKLMEIIDNAATNKQAKFMLQEYQLAFGNTWESTLR